MFELTFSFYQGSSKALSTVILYGDVTSSNFKVAHDKMKQLADDGKCKYVLRLFKQGGSSDKVRLSGEYCCKNYLTT